jgi:L-aspartate oxidase
MPRYDQRGELAPRDVVARAIDVEIKRASLVPGAPACVFLDVTHVDAGEVLTHFPGVAAELKLRGIDLTKDRVPVTPAAHYLCGGVSVDLDGRSSVEGLYVCGETAHTGLHGANRLASNSLLEAVVFAKRAAADSARRVENEKKRDSLGLSRSSLSFLAAERAGEAAQDSAECPDSDPTGRAFDAEAAWASAMRHDLQRVMWASAGIVRDSAGLESAEREVEALLQRCEVETARRGAGLAAIELRNLITVGLVVLRCAGRRKESRGLHYNADFPERVERERKPTKLKTNDLMTNDLTAR